MGSGGDGATAINGPTGPRALPPTFVPLELDRFPRPADEACADTANTLTVSPGQSIAEALSRATPGTTVLVAPGTYTERPAEDTALSVDVEHVCLRAMDGGEVVLQAAPGQRRGIGVNSNRTVVEGFTLRGFGTGVAFWGTVRDVTLQRLNVVAGEGPFLEGIIAYADNRSQPDLGPTVDGLLVLDTHVSGTDLGISCNAGPCAHWWIERTTIADRQSADTSGADAFAFENGRQIALVDSQVSGANADGIDTKADDVVVFGCQVHDVARNGIKIWHGGDVIDTVIDGCGADAALVGAQPARYRYLHVVVARHTPGGEAYVGTWAYDTAQPVQLEIINSIFARNSNGGFYVPAGSQVTISHTLFDDPGAKLLGFGGGPSYMMTDLAQFEADGHGDSDLVADPQFVDVDNGDVSLRPDSPARDRGESVDGLSRDLLGQPRVQGAGPDLGAVEE